MILDCRYRALFFARYSYKDKFLLTKKEYELIKCTCSNCYIEISDLKFIEDKKALEDLIKKLNKDYRLRFEIQGKRIKLLNEIFIDW